jgi:hypothetical protein
LSETETFVVEGESRKGLDGDLKSIIKGKGDRGKVRKTNWNYDYEQ